MCLPFKNIAERTLAEGEHEGIAWQVVYNHGGYRCGYIRVTPGHPWYGRKYNDIEANVHEGLTFSEYGSACPTHGEQEEWWVGFDCAHLQDLPDPELPGGEIHYPWMKQFLLRDATIKTTEYVREMCISLAKQALVAQGEQHEQST